MHLEVCSLLSLLLLELLLSRIANLSCLPFRSLVSISYRYISTIILSVCTLYIQQILDKYFQERKMLQHSIKGPSIGL